MTHNEKIKEKVVKRLRRDARVDASQVMVHVNNGFVTLEGKVPSFRAKNAAENDSFFVPGVTGVDNKLDIRYIVDALPTDMQIQEDVRNALRRDPDVDASKVSIHVDAGIVTITGTVKSYYEKMLVDQIAFNTIGVYDVINKSTIVPTSHITDEALAKKLSARTKNIHFLTQKRSMWKSLMVMSSFQEQFLILSLSQMQSTLLFTHMELKKLMKKTWLSYNLWR